MDTAHAVSKPCSVDLVVACLTYHQGDRYRGLTLRTLAEDP
jgi:hypothetical protein